MVSKPEPQPESPSKFSTLLSPLSPDTQPAATPDPTLHTINYDFDLSDFSADNSVADDMLVLLNRIFTFVGNWAKLINIIVAGQLPMLLFV